MNEDRSVFIKTRAPDQYDEEEYNVTNDIGEIFNFEGGLVAVDDML